MTRSLSWIAVSSEPVGPEELVVRHSVARAAGSVQRDHPRPVVVSCFVCTGPRVASEDSASQLAGRRIGSTPRVADRELEEARNRCRQVHACISTLCTCSVCFLLLAPRAVRLAFARSLVPRTRVCASDGRVTVWGHRLYSRPRSFVRHRPAHRPRRLAARGLYSGGRLRLSPRDIDEHRA